MASAMSDLCKMAELAEIVYASVFAVRRPWVWPCHRFRGMVPRDTPKGRREPLGKVQKKRPRVGPWIG